MTSRASAGGTYSPVGPVPGGRAGVAGEGRRLAALDRFAPPVRDRLRQGAGPGVAQGEEGAGRELVDSLVDGAGRGDVAGPHEPEEGAAVDLAAEARVGAEG